MASKIRWVAILSSLFSEGAQKHLSKVGRKKQVSKCPISTPLDPLLQSYRRSHKILDSFQLSVILVYQPKNGRTLLLNFFAVCASVCLSYHLFFLCVICRLWRTIGITGCPIIIAWSVHCELLQRIGQLLWNTRPCRWGCVAHWNATGPAQRLWWIPGEGKQQIIAWEN